MLEKGELGSSASFGMKQRPDGDMGIDIKFFQEDFLVPGCEQCGGIFKPDVVFFGDNVPKARAEEAMAMAKSRDAILVLGSSLMVMSAFRLIRTAVDQGSRIAIINLGLTHTFDLATLKVESRSGSNKIVDNGLLTFASNIIIGHLNELCFKSASLCNRKAILLCGRQKSRIITGGTIALLPNWNLGYQQCRWSYKTAHRVREVVSTFREKKLPCDMI